MKLSTKVRYGVRAMIELAKHGEGKRVSLAELAGKQRISNKYLEPIITSLKIAGLVDSTMGKGGGYRLTRPAEKITLWDIYSILDVSPILIECERQCPGQKNICPRLEECAAREVWLGLDAVIANYLKAENLHMLAHRELRLQGLQVSRRKKGKIKTDPKPPQSIRDKLIDEMKIVFGQDHKRIEHALAVLEYAERIQEAEGGDPLVIQAAAMLHDIGIQQAERKYGSSAGKYQEIEGPPMARKILDNYSLNEKQMKHICRIIANHHSNKDIDTMEFRCVWDADWLVNFPEEFNHLSQEKRQKMIDKIFKTSTGKQMAEKMFL